MTNRRKPNPRYEINQQVNLLFGDAGCHVFCELKDMSMTGARLASVPLKSVPETLKFFIPSENVALACRVRWTSSNEIGVEFTGEPEKRRRFFDL